MSNKLKLGYTWCFSPKHLDIFAVMFVTVTCHIFRHFSHVSSYRDIIAKTFRSEYFGKKMSREKRRISDGKGGYEKHLNKIPLALGCMVWQSDTPPTSNRIIRRLTESSFSSCHLLRSLASAARRFADYSTS